MRVAWAAQVIATGLMVTVAWLVLRTAPIEAHGKDLALVAMRSLALALVAALGLGAVLFCGVSTGFKSLLLRWLVVSWASATCAVLAATQVTPQLLPESAAVGAALALPTAALAAASYWLACRFRGSR